MSDEHSPELTYVVVYGCGQGGILQPDGTWLTYRDHQSGCPCDRSDEEDE